MLKLILGRSGSGKTTAVLDGLCRRGQIRQQILLVPEQQSHEVERALCQRGGNQVSLYAEVLSFSRMANRIFLAGGGMGTEELDGGGRILLMHTAVKSVSAQLTALRRVSCRPAFLESLLSTVDELKSCCASPHDLFQAGDDLDGAEGDKLRDLSLILGAYDALTSRVAQDPRDRLTRAAETLKQCGWGKNQDIWLDGFTDFTQQQIQLIALLMAQAVDVTLTLTCDDLDGDGDIFAPARRTAQKLLQMARKTNTPSEIVYIKESPPLRNSVLTHLETALFTQETVTLCQESGGIQLFSALSQRGEVEWTASQILNLVQQKNYRFRDIAVVARTFDGYSELISSVFQRYNVPVFCSAMTDILEKPVLSLVTSALEIVSGGYRYEDVFRYLKTGLTDLKQDDIDILENYVLKWKLRGSQWTAKKVWSLHPRGYGMPIEEQDILLLERLDDVRRQVIKPLETLRKNRDKTGAGQAKALYLFLEEIALSHQLIHRMETLQTRGELTLADEYRQLWQILCGGLEQCTALLGDTPMELEEFSALFRLVLSQYDVGSIPVSLDRVMAGETTRQTNHRVRALFLLGADDNSIPLVTGATGLLSDDDRSLLASYGVELNQSGEALLFREMTTVYQVCALPSDYLAITCPTQGAGGEAKRPSFLIERIKLIFPTLVVQKEEELGGEFRLCAPQPALEQAGRNQQVQEALCAIPAYEKQITRLLEVANMSRGALSRNAVDTLYGKKVPMSASRMDLYKSCHFSYFMRYGLKAQPRKTAGFAAPEYGTFVHYILEHFLKDQRWTEAPTAEEGLSPQQKKLLDTLVDEIIERYIKEELGGLEEQTERFRYLFSRLRRSVRSVVENAAEELANSKFKPVSFEFGFAKSGDLPPVELTVDDMTISISGFVDRVDGWVDNNRIYLRVVDYKTGRKSFDLTEIWNGLGLQMLLYLFTLEKQGEAVYGLPVEGAGVLYFPAREATVKGKHAITEAQWQKEANRELVRHGIVLDNPKVLEAMETPQNGAYRFLPLKVGKKDGAISGDALVTAERFGKLQTHIAHILEEICGELTAGNIAADPYWRGPEKNACQYCDFTDACQFESGQGGECKRFLPNVKSNEFWKRLEESETIE